MINGDWNTRNNLKLHHDCSLTACEPESWARTCLRSTRVSFHRDCWRRRSQLISATIFSPNTPTVRVHVGVRKKSENTDLSFTKNKAQWQVKQLSKMISVAFYNISVHIDWNDTVTSKEPCILRSFLFSVVSWSVAPCQTGEGRKRKNMRFSFKLESPKSKLLEDKKTLSLLM